MRKITKSLKKTGIYKFFRRLDKNTRKVVKRFFLRRKLNGRTPVFVYQMGKVASSSIYHSLVRQYPGAVGAAHHIGFENWQSELMYDWFKEGKPLKVICPVREPIGRNISNFFELFIDYAGVPYKESKLSIQELIDIYINKFPHDFPLLWFDKNIKAHFGIDVYDTPFPDSGVATYSRNNVELLVLRIDLDDDTKQQAIRDFLDFPEFIFKNYNVAEEKDYKHAYREFKNSIKLPESNLDHMCESRYFRHFFKPEEIEAIRKKWSNN